MISADPSAKALGDLITALTALGYSTGSVTQVLGPVGYRAALNGHPAAALRCARSNSTCKDRDLLLTTTFFLREPVARGELTALLGEYLTSRLQQAGILSAPSLLTRGSVGDYLVSNVDIRPVDHAQHRISGVLIASDPDASLDVRIPGPDHVPGVGQAPLTLLNQIPSNPVNSLLDLGTGSGVLALSLDAAHTVATDIHDRALAFARASERSLRRLGSSTRGSAVDWRQGSWFEPVNGERFDRIVSNPPFVISDGDIGHIYRDSGLDLDGASRLVAAGAAEHLLPGGFAHLLGAWATDFHESPASRVASWLPEVGIRAWVIQRDEVDPETYVRTWLADESVDLRTDEGRRRSENWLQVFDVQGITRIGMGYLHLQRIDGPTEVTFEEIRTPDLGYFGDEVQEWFLRAEWLAETTTEGILDSRFAVRPSVVRQTVEVVTASGPGFSESELRLTRSDGAQFSHVVDAPLSAIIAGLDPRGLTLTDTAELYCAVHGLDQEEFEDALVPLVVDLVRHGLILPAELL